jgi:pilus assembly protein CpaF
VTGVQTCALPIFPSPRSFEREEEVRKIIERILAPVGRRVDESSPLVDGRLPDGSRVNVVISPVALDGPVITIRKFTQRFFSVKNLIDMKALSHQMAAFFKFIVEDRKNIVVTGRTSSGKTTLLNMLAGFIPAGERIITIEEMAELQLPQPHVVRLEARPSNIQGKGEITSRTLFRNALHMRPDRIIVGECRGAEALDMLQAMNTGHDGSLSTAHSNSPRDLLVRLETMVSMSDIFIDPRTLQKQIASGVDVIIYCARFPDGQRKITSVSEVVPGEGGEIMVNDIYLFHAVDTEDTIVQGEFRPTGYIPKFVRDNPSLLKSEVVQSLFDLEKADRFDINLK